MNTLKITREILNRYGIKANKRYGQNFLIDDNILQNIVGSSNVNKEDLVIEIGPGLGNLTEYILKDAGYVVAVEIDKNMLEILNNRFFNINNLEIINDDILKVNIDDLIKKIEDKTQMSFKNVKVIANLPYYITTPIIFKLLENSNRISDITVMVQKEVAERMNATSKSKDYGILTIMVDYYSTADILITVPNSSFIPAPEVTSSVISLKKNRKYNVVNEKIFFELVHASFAKRRKKMINSLEMSKFMNFDKEKLKEIFVKCDINENARAEELKINDYIKIADYIAQM